ncbi:hypothetical protein F2Q69_00032667 [Brassica cretica]|uniref:Uncharacterized protein n=1 Tax=Brassica cretica TaxID=69181 RepID=A0A8S9SQQ6_BRACR|nr:hypothetical protein F2Q69_00032667 [Brassica cretica]
MLLFELQCDEKDRTSDFFLVLMIMLLQRTRYSLISYVTGQTGLIFTLPDVSGPPLLKLIKSGSCCLLVDNVAVFFLSSKLTLKPLKTSFTSANSSPIIIFPPGSCFSLWIKPDQTLTNDLGKKAT